MRRRCDVFDYGEPLRAYHDVMVNLPQAVRDKLRDHRKANQDRILSRLPEGITASSGSFIKQGSYAMRTTIQEAGNAYDIDDGLVLRRDELKWAGDLDLPPASVKGMVRDAAKDARFSQEPQIMPNCVRIFYAEGHHVDVATYRTYDEGEQTIQEIASDGTWKPSDPQRITSWFLSLIQDLNSQSDGAGSQLRRLVRLLKRFAKSRGADWDMPNGLKLTMLAADCYDHAETDDVAFHSLLQSVSTRLADSLVVTNLADTGEPKVELTKTSWDANMALLRDKIGEALQQLSVLGESGCTLADAEAAWDWVFQTDGFFSALGKDAAKAVEVFTKTALLKAGVARTDGTMRIGTSGVPNAGHRFYGED
jgi:hypothetical protein